MMFRLLKQIMPYEGIKDSGLGKEGPCYTIEEMKEV